MGKETNGTEGEETSIDRFLNDPEWQGIEERIEENDRAEEVLEAWRLEALSFFIENQTLREEVERLKTTLDARAFAELAARAFAENTRAEAWKQAALAWRETAETPLHSPELYEIEARATEKIRAAEKAETEALATRRTVASLRVVRR